MAEHNHAPEYELVSKAALTDEMLRQVDVDPNKTARHIYDEVTANIAADEHESIRRFSEVRSRINRKRNTHIPPIPATVNDVEIRNTWKRTNDGLRFLAKKIMHGESQYFVQTTRFAVLVNAKMCIWMPLSRRHPDRMSNCW